ncbi:MAG: hypothetical protein NZM08_05240, partial [Chitinophagales bacterium]|nr:hypothetical protein [Chitinophagales bacterium]
MAFCFHPRWNKTQSEATVGWDVSGYYQYLPALFIYRDLKHCAYLDSVIIQYRFAPEMQQAHTHPLTGNCVFKYPSGLALTMLPFFLAGHAYALFSRSAPADGFSFPYQFAIGAGMFLYGLLGVFLLRLLLLRYFSDRVVALILLAYVAGTNYLNYAAVDQAMTHSVLFTI